MRLNGVRRYYFQEDGCTDVGFVVRFEEGFFNMLDVYKLRDAAKKAFPDQDPDCFIIRVTRYRLIMCHLVEGDVDQIKDFNEDRYEKVYKSPYDWK